MRTRTIDGRKLAIRLGVFALGLGIGTGLARVAEARQEERLPLPEASEVIDAHIEATGGAEAHRAVRTRVSRGTVTFQAMDLEADVEIWQQAPQNQRFTLSIPGMGVDERGVFANLAWEDPLQGGARILQGEQAENAIRRAKMHPWLSMARDYPKMETVGVQEIEGESCYRVDLEAANGAQETRWFSTETGLHTKTMLTVDSQAGPLVVEIFVSDYRPVGGVRVSHRLVQRVVGADQVFQIESVEQNIEVPPEVWELPEDVAMLLEE